MATRGSAATNANAPEPHEQAERIRAVMEPRLRVEDEWFVISMRWWDLWKDYTSFDNPDGGEPEPLLRSISGISLGMTKGAMPPQIDNFDLVMGPDSERLQKGLMERRDFIFVHKDAWKLLLSWYGGGPALKRRVISVSAGRSAELRVELYPYWLSVFQVDGGGMVKKESKMDCQLSRSETLEKVLIHIGLNLEMKDVSNDSARLWHRGSLDVDQTDTDALEGWEQLQPRSATLEELGVVDGASLLLETPNKVYSAGLSRVEKLTWPFFHRLRVDYKEHLYKIPSESRLETDDKIDAAAPRSVFSHSTKEWREEDSWYVATVVGEDETRVLVLFHNREKPKQRGVTVELLVTEGKQCGPGNPIIVGNIYEAADSKANWHPVRIVSKSADGTYAADVQDEDTHWPVVAEKWVRSRSELTDNAKAALQKVFKRYADNGRIEGSILGMVSCATNEMVQADSPIVRSFLQRPYGDGIGIELDGFMDFWRVKLSLSNRYFVQQQLSRLFERVGASLDEASESYTLLKQGKEWIERTSPRLAQYRSKSEPSNRYGDAKPWGDWARFDQVDVRLDGEWKQAQVQEVNWEEMTILVKTKQIGAWSSSFVAQTEWLPMESERLAEYQTKSLQDPEDLSDPAPLLARSKSRGGVCPKPGACGLQNLGNTCFMNSTLQCLSNTAALRSFFAGGPDRAPAFIDQICTSPLSMEGKLAKEFSRVLRMMWSNEKSSVAPAELKKLIGVKRPEFSGYQQHDAQELLSFLLDGLHEDVNRAPYPRQNVEDPSMEGLPEEEIAKKMWEKHLRSNNSHIVELFQFQLRSELECPVCANKSVTFDPIMYLTLPVPKPPHSVELTVMPLDFPATPMSTVNVEVASDASFQQLEKALWKELGRSPSDNHRCFAFTDIMNNRVWRYFEKHNRVSDIKANDKVYAIEVQLTPDTAEILHTFVTVLFRKKQRPTSSFAMSSSYTYEKCACPRVLALAKGATNAQVHSQMIGMAEAMLKHSGVPQPWDLSVVTMSDGFGSTSGINIPNNDQVFPIPAGSSPNASVDIPDTEKARLMVDGLPPVRGSASGGGPGATTVYNCLAKNGEREQLSEFDSAYCGKCKQHRCQFKTLGLWSLPQVLVIHLRRFGRERIDGPLQKISIPIEFPEELDLNKFTVGTGHPKYELFGVSNHEGNLGGGHYTAHALVTNTSDTGSGTGEWFKFNDSNASPAAGGFSDLDRRAAYLLFYRRKCVSL